MNYQQQRDEMRKIIQHEIQLAAFIYSYSFQKSGLSKTQFWDTFKPELKKKISDFVCSLEALPPAGDSQVFTQEIINETADELAEF